MTDQHDQGDHNDPFIHPEEEATPPSREAWARGPDPDKPCPSPPGPGADPRRDRPSRPMRTLSY